MTDLILTTRATPEGAVLTVAGDLDHDSNAALRVAMGAITLEPGQTLTLDLAGLTFCDSSGITALIAVHNLAQAQGAKTVLVDTPASTVRILRFIGLDQIFQIHPAAEDDEEPSR